jgi:hypothetical protein
MASRVFAKGREMRTLNTACLFSTALTGDSLRHIRRGRAFPQRERREGSAHCVEPI